MRSEIDESTLELKTAKKYWQLIKEHWCYKSFLLSLKTNTLIVNVFPSHQKTIVAWSSGLNNEILHICFGSKHGFDMVEK
jgi:hypothetical protein